MSSRSSIAQVWIAGQRRLALEVEQGEVGAVYQAGEVGILRLGPAAVPSGYYDHHLFAVTGHYLGPLIQRAADELAEALLGGL